MGVAGPGIAASMLTQLDWRWIFLINLPLGLLALIAGVCAADAVANGFGLSSIVGAVISAIGILPLLRDGRR